MQTAYVAAGLATMLCAPLAGHAAGAGTGVQVQAVNQAQHVKGHIVDETGQPMIGVTVRVKGSKAASVTDLDGNFQLSAAPGETI